MLAEGVSLTYLLVLIIPIIMFIKTWDNWWVLLIFALLITSVVVRLLKWFFRKLSPRPGTAHNCNAFCMGGPVGGEPGFPSGHMTSTTMFVVALWLHFGNNFILMAGLPWIALMGWSRWAKNCHTWQQVLGGIFTGTVAAHLFSRLT